MMCVSQTFTHILMVGELRNLVESARKIAEGQKVVLDNIERISMFLEDLDSTCNAVKEVCFLVSL